MTKKTPEVVVEEKSPRRGFSFRRVEQAENLFVDGMIVGVDCPGEIVGDQFIPGEEPTDEMRQSPWWMVEDMVDLDRLVGGMYAIVVQLKMMRERIDNEIKRIEARISKTVNAYAKVVPMPDPDKQWKQTKGPVTQFNYRYQPERARVWKLVDKDLARINLLLKKREVEEMVSTKELNDYYDEHGKLPPGYEFETQPPVSVSFKDEGLVAAQKDKA